MFSTVATLAHGLVGRCLPTLLALQDAPRAGGAAPSGGGSSSGGGAQGGMLQLLLPLGMVAFLYFFMIRPANKQRKDQESLQKGLQKGDKVVTTSGMIGTVIGTDDQFITLEISEKVRVKFLRESVSRKLEAPGSTPSGAGAKASGAAAAADAKK